MNPRIKQDVYLSYAFELRPREIELIEKYGAILPETIIDCHAHSNPPNAVGELDQPTCEHMMSTFPIWTIRQSRQAQAKLLPGKRIRTIRFANAYRGINHRLSNEYLFDHATDDDLVAAYGIPTDLEYTIRILRGPRSCALKMYYWYSDPPAEEIYQFFRPEALEEAQSLGKPIILHLPDFLYLCADDLRRLLRDFPRLPIVLAHMALVEEEVPGLRELYAEFARYKTVVIDTAMNRSARLVRLALETFGPDRILFGTDDPLHLIRATAYENPELGWRLAADHQYHWVDPAEQSEYGYLANHAVHCLWQNLEAISLGINSYAQKHSQSIWRRIMHDNAAHTFRL